MVKNLYIIRHGETEQNKNHIIQGSGIDSDLNETGRAQAEAFYQYYKHIQFDKIYTSALKRTHQSVAKFIQAQIPWEIVPELNEISWGIKEGVQINREEEAYYKGLLHTWQMGYTDTRITGGESPNEVYARLIQAMDYINSKTNEKNVLMCLHGRTLRILLCLLTKNPLSEMENFLHRNLCLYLVEYDTKKYTIKIRNGFVEPPNMVFETL